ncbi:MAG TPA: hypothetical protein VGL11_12905 [Candidatus Binatia bacterium]
MIQNNAKSRLFLTAAVLVLVLTPFHPVHDYLDAANPAERRSAQANIEKKENGSIPLSEIQFRITDTLLGKARLFPEKVRETVLVKPYGCPAPEGGKEIDGRFRLEFEIGGNRLAAYSLDLSFVEGHLAWNPGLKKSNLPLAGQSKEQIVIIQYQSCNTIEALIFGYDLQEKEIVRYSFSDSEPWRVSLSVGTRFLPDGRIEVLNAGKPDGVLQKRIYNNAVWGTFLDRYLFDQPTHRFLKIPMVVGMRVHPDPAGAPPHELVLYEDGYLTDMHGREKFVPKVEVDKLLDSDAAKGVLRLREKSGRWLQSDFGSDSPVHDYFFSINDRNFSARCGQTGCPKEIQFIKDKLLQFWSEDPAK